MKPYTFVSARPGIPPPPGSVNIGYQNDGRGKILTAISQTRKHGTIPGKVNSTDHSCIYSYDGQVHHTKSFYWLKINDVRCLFLWRSECHATMPSQRDIDERLGPGAFVIRPSLLLTRGRSILYPALAVTPWGVIPGWVQDSVCYYVYASEERVTPEFYWLIALPPPPPTVDPDLNQCHEFSSQGNFPFTSMFSRAFQFMNIRKFMFPAGTPQPVRLKPTKLGIGDAGIYQIHLRKPAKKLSLLCKGKDIADHEDIDNDEWRDCLHLLADLQLDGCVPTQSSHTIATHGRVKLEKLKPGTHALLQIQNGENETIAKTRVQEGVYFGHQVIGRALLMSLRSSQESTLIHTYKDYSTKRRRSRAMSNAF